MRAYVSRFKLYELFVWIDLVCRLWRDIIMIHPIKCRGRQTNRLFMNRNTTKAKQVSDMLAEGSQQCGEAGNELKRPKKANLGVGRKNRFRH